MYFFPISREESIFKEIRMPKRKKKKKPYENIYTDAMESFSLPSVFGFLFLKLD